jgi:hypothetical protein
MKILYFLRRRVYGGEYNRQWYTWVYYATDDRYPIIWHGAGDPYPVRTPTKEEIRQAIGQALKIPSESIELELKR